MPWAAPTYVIRWKVLETGEEQTPIGPFDEEHKAVNHLIANGWVQGDGGLWENSQSTGALVAWVDRLRSEMDPYL